MRVFLKGDPHGQFHGLKKFLKDNKTTTKDLLIYLGDVGLNYNLDEHDDQRKRFLSELPITFLCIRGNHEERPQYVEGMEFEYCHHIRTYCWHQEEYPNIWYYNCGEFMLNNKRCLAISGAYSVDKPYRLLMGYKWFKDEQPTENEKNYVRELIQGNNKFDYVFTHTCPISREPVHLFLNNIDQSKIDKTTELFLEEVYQQIDRDYLDTWFLGHYHHDEWLGGGLRLLYNDYVQLNLEE